MDIEKYYKDAKYALENMTDEEFLESLKEVGLDDCPIRKVENKEDVITNLEWIYKFAKENHELEMASWGTGWDDVMNIAKYTLDYLKEKRR